MFLVVCMFVHSLHIFFCGAEMLWWWHKIIGPITLPPNRRRCCDVPRPTPAVHPTPRPTLPRPASPRAQSFGSFCRAVGSWHDPDPDVKVPPELAEAFKQILQVSAPCVACVPCLRATFCVYFQKRAAVARFLCC